MKKTLTVIALIAAIGFFASQGAQARRGLGNGPGNGFGPGSCGNCDQNYTVDEEVRQTFIEETEELRTRLFELRSDYFALVNGENPDKDTAQTLWSEMFDVRQQIQEKAQEAGLNPQAVRSGWAGKGPGRRGCRSFDHNNGNYDCDGRGCAQGGSITAQ